MLFNSFEFIFFFLPVTYFVFIYLHQKGSVQSALGWLLGASLFFYAWWNPKYLVIMLASIAFNFIVGRLLIRCHASSKLLLKRVVFFMAIGVNLSLIGYYKYGFFFIRNVNALFGTSLVMESVVMPIAISFFTFQQISYLADVYRGELGPIRFLHYSLVVTFFPHLIAGPIVHYRELVPQFADQKLLIRFRDIAIGLTIFVIGLFKKVVLADTISVYAQDAFDAAALGQSLDFFKAWGGILSFTFQIYFDFSGYSDMAIGLGRLFGIKLPVNFNSPYKAVSIIDFWRRWHITLSQFLLHYVYIPLGGNRTGPGRRYLNLMVTMLLGGLWHGAGWTFVLWGGLHGIYLVVNHAWEKIGKNLGNAAFGRIVTFFAVVLAWVLFRADSLPSAVYFFKSLAGSHGFLSAHVRSGEIKILYQWAWLLGLMGIVFILSNTQEWLCRFKPALHAVENSCGHPKHFQPQDRMRQALFFWYPSSFHAVCLGAMAALSLLLLFIEKNSEFIYFQF
ncbi:MAG: MBOAT family protein [Candidatus Omnitrophica bacterium]|nr:MBOAT family protein [Candidatus Omnitrophota bacterium]